MELPEVECVFDTSRSIYCLKPKGSHVGLSGDEIEEVARRCNSHEKFKDIIFEVARQAIAKYDINAPPLTKNKFANELVDSYERALKEAEKK